MSAQAMIAETGPPPGRSAAEATERLVARLWLWALLAAVTLLVMGPLGALIYGALQSDSPGAPGVHFTVDNMLKVYQGLFDDGWTGRATVNSLLLAVPVTICSTSIGVLLAWLVARTDMPGRRSFEFLFLLPMLYSPLVGVIGWSVLADPRAGLINIAARSMFGTTGPLVKVYSWGGIVWVMSFYFVPYAFLMNLGTFRAMDPALEEAASISGANLFKRLFGITLPMMLASIAAAAIFIFTLSLEQFAIPGFLGATMRLETLAYSIYQRTNMFPADLPGSAAAGTLLLIISGLSLWAYRQMTRRSEKFVTVTARGYKPAATPLGWLRLVAAGIAGTIFVIGSGLPLTAVLLRAMMPVRTTTLDISALGFGNFTTLFATEAVRRGTINSLWLSAAAATVCAALGFLIAVAIIRQRRRIAVTLTDYLISLPVGLPGTVFGIGMLWAYVYTPLYATAWILLLAFVIRYTVYSVRGFSAGIMQIDPALEEAAIVSGAPPARSFLFVDVPLLKPVLASLWLLTFLMVIRELSISVILYSPRSATLPILTWTFLSDGFYGVASALAIVQLIAVAAITLVFRKFFGVDVRTRSKD